MTVIEDLAFIGFDLEDTPDLTTEIGNGIHVILNTEAITFSLQNSESYLFSLVASAASAGLV